MIKVCHLFTFISIAIQLQSYGSVSPLPIPTEIVLRTLHGATLQSFFFYSWLCSVNVKLAIVISDPRLK